MALDTKKLRANPTTLGSGTPKIWDIYYDGDIKDFADAASLDVWCKKVGVKANDAVHIETSEATGSNNYKGSLGCFLMDQGKMTFFVAVLSKIS